MLYSLLDYIKKMSASASSNGVVINEELLLLLTLSCSVAVTVVTFVLKGIGLYTIAKRENVKKPYYAFIPFLSFYLLGKIVGGVKIFGYRVKNVGLITMITMLLYYVTAAVYDGFMCYENIVGLFTTGKLGSVIDKYGSVWIDVVLSVLMTVSRLVYVVFGIFMIFTFFLYYGGKYQLLFSLLSIFFDPLFGIFVFALRKKERFDYGNYMKMRFDSYKGTRSGGGFNNPQEPFTTNEDLKDPFEEYRDRKHVKTEDIDVFEDYSDKTDDKDKKDN